MTITNPPNFTAINVDASADSSVHIATLDTRTGPDGFPFGQITGLAPAAINYKYADTGSLTLRTGGGGINVNVLATGVSTSLVGNGPTTVNVGNRVSGVQEILGPLTITNPPDFTTLNVVDSADQTAQPRRSTPSPTPAASPSAASQAWPRPRSTTSRPTSTRRRSTAARAPTPSSSSRCLSRRSP